MKTTSQRKDKPTLHRKSFIKPSVFQFPQLLQNTNKYALSANRVLIPSSQTPDPSFKPVNFLIRKETQKYSLPIKVQRNSARMIIQNPQKVINQKSNLSQIIQSSEDCSVYQLSELENFDDLLSSIQLRIKEQDKNITQIAIDVCSLDAIDIRDMANQQKLFNLLMDQCQQQKMYFHKELMRVLIILVEECLTRDDLDSEMLSKFNFFMFDKSHQHILAQLINRAGFLVCYIKPEKLILFCKTIHTILHIIDNDDIFKQGLNLLLRSRIVRQTLSEMKFHVNEKVSDQLRQFRIC